MFSATSFEAAYSRTSAGHLIFTSPDEAPLDHEDWCELFVRFSQTALYPPEPDIGAGLTWDGDIDEIRMSVFGRMCLLESNDFEAAKAFLLKHYGTELWLLGDDAAELEFSEAA